MNFETDLCDYSGELKVNAKKQNKTLGEKFSINMSEWKKQTRQVTMGTYFVIPGSDFLCGKFKKNYSEPMKKKPSCGQVCIVYHLKVIKI